MKKRTVLIVVHAAIIFEPVALMAQSEDRDALTGRVEAVSYDTSQMTLAFIWEWDHAPTWRGRRVMDTVSFSYAGLSGNDMWTALILDPENSFYTVHYYQGDVCIGERSEPVSGLEPLTFPTVQTFDGQRGWARDGCLTLCLRERVPANDLYGITIAFGYGHPSALHKTAEVQGDGFGALTFGKHTNIMYDRTVIQNINGEIEYFDGPEPENSSVLQVLTAVGLAALFLSAALLPCAVLRKRAK